ncbi:protein LEAD-SENSITIVE 1-like [Wolffia australiana]
MGLLSHRVEKTEIKPGDHIYTWRAVYTYSHHGIYVGGSKVVHFTRKKEHSSSADCPTFPDCGFKQPGSGVVLTCLDCFLGTGLPHCFEYGASPSVFLTKLRGGTCTTAVADQPELTIHRAMHLLRTGFGSYHVFQNNCEDFAIYCKTGLLTLDRAGPGKSGQASAFLNFPLAAALSSPLQMIMASPAGVAVAAAGVYCAGRYMTDVGVRRDVIKIEVEDLASNLGLDGEASVDEEPQ